MCIIMVNNIGKFLSCNINGLEVKTNGVKRNKIHIPEVINAVNKSDFIV